MTRRKRDQYSPLARLRRAAGLTQVQAAARLGGAYQRIGELERGANANPTLSLISRLALTYGCLPADIIAAIAGPSRPATATPPAPPPGETARTD